MKTEQKKALISEGSARGLSTSPLLYDDDIGMKEYISDHMLPIPNFPPWLNLWKFEELFHYNLYIYRCALKGYDYFE